MNCAGIAILTIAKKFKIKIDAMPSFVYDEFCNLQHLRDYLEQIGLFVGFADNGGSAEFVFSELEKHDIFLLIAYNGIRGDKSKHIEIVTQMDKSNRIKLPHIDEWLEQSDFDIKLYTFVSNREFSNVVRFHS